MTIEDSWGGDIITAAIAHLAHSTPEHLRFSATDFNSYVTVQQRNGCAATRRRHDACIGRSGPRHRAGHGRARRPGCYLLAMQFIDDAQFRTATPWNELIDAIRDAYRVGGDVPVRHHHKIPGQGREGITLLLMPAWSDDFGVKLAAISPSNKLLGQPTLHGIYVLFDGDTGIPNAVLDAGSLTARRTAAASALASRSLSRPDSKTLLVIGTGRVARNLIQAHCAVRPIEEVRIWGRTAESAQAVADEAAQAAGVRCISVSNVEAGANGADIISSAVPSKSPVLMGEWVDVGTHVDLVGAYTPEMCEADVELIDKIGHVFVDTIDGARDEAGDLIQAADAGQFSFDAVAGDLFRIAKENEPLRQSADDITLYKSVGSALQDLAAARLCVRNLACDTI